MGGKKYKGQKVAMHSIYSWSSAELYCSIFFWQCVRPYYCNRSQESLIHRGLSGKEKLLEQSPFLEPVVKSSDQSTLSPWASWGLGTQASVLQWPPVHWGEREAERGKGSERKRQRNRKKEKRQRCSDWGRERERERQPWSAGEKKHHNSQTHTRNWLNIGVFIELSYKAGGTQEWVLISHNAYTHIYTAPYMRVCFTPVHLYLDRSLCTGDHFCEQNRLSNSTVNIVQGIGVRQKPTGGHLVHFKPVI